MIKKAYIPSYSGFEDERTEEHRTDEMAPKSTAVENQNSHVSPAVQPMKAALGFGSAKGLGEWMILISGGAQKALRETRRRDTQSFKTILHKIRWALHSPNAHLSLCMCFGRALSKGRFSADNHTQLNDEGEIPIYEAKITRDLRLVVCLMSGAQHSDCRSASPVPGWLCSTWPWSEHPFLPPK